MNDRSGVDIAAVSMDAMLKHVGPSTVGMVDTQHPEMPLSSGVLIEIACHTFIATAKHCVPLAPEKRLWILPNQPKTYTEGMLGFRRIERHDDLDLAVLEIDAEALGGYAPGKSPASLDQIGLLGIGREEKPMGVCGCPVQFYSGSGSEANPGRALMNFYMTSVFPESDFPTVPEDDRPADADEDIFYEYASEGIQLQTGATTSLYSPIGFSGGGVWDAGFTKGELWQPGNARLFGIQSRWLESSRYVRAIQIKHWLTFVASKFPDCRNEIATHFPSLEIGSQ